MIVKNSDMVMNLKHFMEGFDEFFDLSKNNNNNQHDKLINVINSLEEKKAEIKTQLKQAAKKDKNSSESYDLCKEYTVLTKLIRKAKKRLASV